MGRGWFYDNNEFYDRRGVLSTVVSMIKVLYGLSLEEYTKDLVMLQLANRQVPGGMALAWRC